MNVAKERSLIGKIGFILNLLLWLTLAAALSLAFTPLTVYMLKPLMIKEDVRNADVIVVLAGGVDKGRYLNLVSSQRLVRGAQLYFEGRAKKILLSGGLSPEGGVVEATVMAQEARRLNIPPQDIILEKNSKRTYDQAVEIKKIADALHLKSIILVTSFSHMKRSLMAFEQAGFKVYPAPADPYELYLEKPMERLALFPLIIHEYGGIIYYKFRGWI